MNKKILLFFMLFILNKLDASGGNVGRGVTANSIAARSSEEDYSDGDGRCDVNGLWSSSSNESGFGLQAAIELNGFVTAMQGDIDRMRADHERQDNLNHKRFNELQERFNELQAQVVFLMARLGISLHVQGVCEQDVQGETARVSQVQRSSGRSTPDSDLCTSQVNLLRLPK